MRNTEYRVDGASSNKARNKQDEQEQKQKDEKGAQTEPPVNSYITEV